MFDHILRSDTQACLLAAVMWLLAVDKYCRWHTGVLLHKYLTDGAPTWFGIFVVKLV